MLIEISKDKEVLWHMWHGFRCDVDGFGRKIYVQPTRPPYVNTDHGCRLLRCVEVVYSGVQVLTILLAVKRPLLFDIVYPSFFFFGFTKNSLPPWTLTPVLMRRHPEVPCRSKGTSG